MKKFNFFIAAYFIFLFLLFIINAILEASTEYALIMIYYPYKLNKTEYIVIERGAFAATTNYYHERYNLFLMKKKESYSHKI